MRYDVRVAPHHGGGEGRFEHEQEEPLLVGDLIRTTNMLYQVTRILPSDDADGEFDAVIEAKWAAGPAQAEFRP